MNITKIITGLALSMLLSSGMTVAGPDKTTSLFMDTNASLFDLGMYKLDMRLQNLSFTPVFEENLDPPFLSSRYIWDDDKIRIIVSYYKPLGDKGDRAYARKKCLSAFSKLREDALVNPLSGKVFYSATNTRWADLFDHSGYTKGGVDKEVVNLDNKFTLLCNWVFRDSSLSSMILEAPLLSKSYSETKL